MESTKHQCEDYIIQSDAETEVWEGESHTEDYQQEKSYEMTGKLKKLQVQRKIRTLTQELWYVKKKIKNILLQGDEKKNAAELYLLKEKKYSLKYKLLHVILTNQL